MKRLLAILLAACLLAAGAAAMAEAKATTTPLPDEADALIGDDEGFSEDDLEDASLAEGYPLTEEAEAGEKAATAAPTANGEEAPEEDGKGEGAEKSEPEEPDKTAGEEKPAETAEEEEGDEADEAAGAEGIRVWFEEGFGLTFPAGWVSYTVTEKDRAQGIRYVLGDGSGEHYLYIRAQKSGLSDAGALEEAIGQAEGLELTGALEFGGKPFTAFIDGDKDASGCATLWGSEVITFLFVPRSDSAYLSAVTGLMETFEISK